MLNQVTISIPQTLYQRMRELARSRNMPIDTVLETAVSLVEAQPHNQETLAMAQEEAAYLAHHQALSTTYAGQYVAFFQGQLIDYDSNELALLHRLDANYPDDVVLMKRVEPLPQPTLRFRSPRLLPPSL